MPVKFDLSLATNRELICELLHRLNNEDDQLKDELTRGILPNDRVPKDIYLKISSGEPELSKREFQTLCLIAKGCNLHQISDALGIAYQTVATYRDRVKNKTGAKNDVQLTHYALKRGHISLHEETETS